jgi:hypothetical protein
MTATAAVAKQVERQGAEDAKVGNAKKSRWGGHSFLSALRGPPGIDPPPLIQLPLVFPPWRPPRLGVHTLPPSPAAAALLRRKRGEDAVAAAKGAPPRKTAKHKLATFFCLR